MRTHLAPRAGPGEILAPSLSCAAVTLILLALVSCGDNNGGPSNPNPAPNPSPTAVFGPACHLQRCTFTDSSTDDEAVAAWRWDFGDGTEPSTEQNPVHTYTADSSQYRVTLRVTDTEGAVDSAFRDITVTDAPECGFASSPTDYIPCRLFIPYGDQVQVTVRSETDCTADGDTLRIFSPFDSQVFTDGCHAEKDVPTYLIGASPFVGHPTRLYLAITLNSEDPDAVAPSVQQEGGYPQWTMRFDDGGHPHDLSEPDFNDLVLTFTAAPLGPNPWDY